MINIYRLRAKSNSPVDYRLASSAERERCSRAVKLLMFKPRSRARDSVLLSAWASLNINLMREERLQH